MSFRKAHNAKRTFSATLLLVVMVMLVGVKAVHTHHYVESERVTCSDCEHHRFHHGHVQSGDGGNLDCVLCQFFSTPFHEAKGTHFVAILCDCHSFCICLVADVCCSGQMHLIPRAPPVCLS